MALFPSAPGGVQIEVLPRWPGKIVATGGIKAEATGGTVTIQGDIPSLVVVSPEDNEGRYVWVYNEDTETNERVELINLPTQNQTWDQVEDKPTEFPPEAHTHPASEISDSTTVGREVLTAVDKDAARTAIDAAHLVHTHPVGAITNFDEAVDDRIATLLQEGSGINLSYNDGAGTLTISTSATGPTTSLATYTGLLSTPASIPLDNTTPEWTEGASLINTSITPSSALNRVRIFLNGWATTAADTDVIVALFRGTTCVRAVVIGAKASAPIHLSIICEDSPATTSSTTYTVRVGCSSATVLNINHVTLSPAEYFPASISAVTLIAHEVIP